MSGKPVHPESRKARQKAQESIRKQQKKSMQNKKQQGRSNEEKRLMWFYRRIFGPGGLEEQAGEGTITRDMARELIEKYINRADEEILELRKKRRGRSQVSSREKNLLLRKEAELQEFGSRGAVFPDVFSRNKLDHFRVWNVKSPLKKSAATVRIRSELSELADMSPAAAATASLTASSSSKKLAGTSDASKPNPFASSSSSSSSSTAATAMNTE